MDRETVSGLLDEGFERWLDAQSRHLTGCVSEYWDDERRKPVHETAGAAPDARDSQG